MRLISAEFVKSVLDIRQCPQDNLPHIAFAGRSNVGKSSLINSLLNRKKLAQVSSSPGKTRTLNFYLINRAFYFVDLPGYGYARVSHKMSFEWKRVVDDYFHGCGHLKGIVAITDVRHPVSALDLDLMEWLAAKNKKFCVVGTKADKLGGNMLKIQLDHQRRSASCYGVDEIIAYSSVTGLGKKDLWARITGFLEGGS